ncbi:uncharacterized protein (TIGR03089 family) [Aeromicrobium panaciterrae]|uniref:Uncharacterized protein (TIGR03089 family) n=1 Tax=Aeromicrobium panaciterrae TaxID=363861 RepID=A0ABU1UM05_9ACTN|nr:TIGR03089 family protein [Aeromicrobium panaciterrae]MDR7086213.1 uncharacterized protein (TIGR03089 family) [Aeromicrobium panaciterrae]
MSLDKLLAGITDASVPLLTYYDISTGERVELSGTTTANWVAKTSNFLVDDLDADSSSRIRIGIPTHWLRFVWILSAWNVGAAIVDSAADIGLSGPELEGDERHRVAASLRPLGGRFISEPEGFLDLGAEVPGHGDHFFASDPPTEAAVALDFGGVSRTHAQLLATPSDSRRVLVEPGTVERDAQLIVAACLGGGSLVVVTSATPADLTRVAQQESAQIT